MNVLPDYISLSHWASLWCALLKFDQRPVEVFWMEEQDRKTMSPSLWLSCSKDASATRHQVIADSSNISNFVANMVYSTSRITIQEC